MNYLGWIGTALLVAGQCFVGERARLGFLIACLGELLWCVKAGWAQQIDLLVVCWIFSALYIWNYVKWGKS